MIIFIFKIPKIFIFGIFCFMNAFVINVDGEELEVTNEMIDFYKKQTGKVRATKKGIEKFFNSLIDNFLLKKIF